MKRLPLRLLQLLMVMLSLSFAVQNHAVEAAGKKQAGAKQTGKKYQKPKPTKFLRVVRNKKETPQSLETAIVRYVPVAGNGKLVVDLIGAVHIGDRSYYRQLNKRFADYDVVLYELVAPKGTRIKKSSRNSSPFALIIKNVLNLESQVSRIDYMKKNFVHADMSPLEMSKAMQKRGETSLTLISGILTDMFRRQHSKKPRKKGRNTPQIDLLTLLLDPNRAIKLKRILADQFDDLGASGGFGKTLNTLLITDRNKAALKVLDQQIKKGKKKIAIFYGAAHMPDFEKRLLSEFGLKRTKVEWLMAWDIED
ncbi:MAG: hypothetical protein IID45_02770 [Planctomycetes bacterium]|nr:hypothetical protein [Planctomycetota bacterium]